MEIIEFDPTTIASASITINKRGLKFTGDITTEVSANQLAWTKGDTFVDLGTDTPQLLKHYVTTIESETIDDLLQYTTSTITPTADGHLASKKYVDDTTNGGAVSHDTVIIAGTAGATIAAGEIVYFDATAKEWLLADASTAASAENVILGVAQGAGTDGNAITSGVLLSGLDTNQTGMTAGTKQYLSDTAGALSESPGTVEVTIGFSQSGSTTELIFDPRNDQQINEDQQDALAGDGGTPSATNKYQTERSTRFGYRTMTAGATINGATLPVPVYQNDSDNEFYACDANDTAAMKYLGFAISNGTDGNDIDVQFTGIVSGFTGLSEGEKYYVSDTAGTIASTVGTQEILVGVAISETELLIQKGRRHASGITSFTSTTTTAITVGFRPSKVRVVATSAGGVNGDQAMSSGGWTVQGSDDCAYIGADGSVLGLAGTSANSWYIRSNAAAVNHSGTITSVTDTGFTLNNTETTDGTTAHIYWEAEGEL